MPSEATADGEPAMTEPTARTRSAFAGSKPAALIGVLHSGQAGRNSSGTPTKLGNGRCDFRENSPMCSDELDDLYRELTDPTR